MGFGLLAARAGYPGVFQTAAGCLFLANNFRKPWWIAPAMNSEMFAHPAVAGALAELERWGCRVLPTSEGRMACGTSGPGRLREPDEAAALVAEAFT